MHTLEAVGRALNRALGAESFVSLCTWLSKEAACTDEELVTAFILLDRYVANEGVVSSGPWGKERILAMSMLLAMKVCRDKAPLNSMVAKLSDYLEYSEILTSSADTQHEEQAMEPKVKTPTRCDHQNPILSRKRLKMSPPTSSIPITVKRPMHKVCTDMRSSGLYFTQEEITELRIDIASSANTDECLVSRSPSSTSSTPRSVVIS